MSVDAPADIHVEDSEYLRHPSGPLLARIYRAKQGRTVDGFFKELPASTDHPVFRVEPVS